jgi:hypothetical protein
MSNELTVIDAQVETHQPALVNADPKTSIENAAKIATAIADVIEKQKLYINIQGRKYVKVDAFIALGNIQGIFPKETKVVEHEDGTFESSVDLIDRATGRVIGGASAICGMDEPTWKNRPRFARRSMATTRATGKAFRLHHAWILALAGYETTPSEEMDHTITTAPADGYYQGREDQDKNLTAYLTKKEIPADKQKIIKARMMSRHSSELEDIIKEVAAQ